MSGSGSEHPLRPEEPGGIRSVAALLGVLALAALIVGGAWRYTREQIADNASRGTLAEVTAVLPAALLRSGARQDVVWLDTGGGQPVPVYRVWRDGDPVAAVLTIDKPGGYGGPVRLLVGMATDGRILGVRVSGHAETPGIGAAIADGDPGWLDAFAGRSLRDPPASRWAVRQDGGEFDAIAGATISSRAVVAGVRDAMQYFAAHRDELFAPRQEARGRQ